MSCDYWELVGLAPAGGVDNLVNEESDVDVQLNNRHMMIRGDTLTKILKVRSAVVQCFRDHFFDRGYYEVSACACTGMKRVLLLSIGGKNVFFLICSLRFLIFFFC